MHIESNVLAIEKFRYCNGKRDITANVLSVCSKDMKFIYRLQGWKELASRTKVLWDAISRMNGLIVPTG